MKKFLLATLAIVGGLVGAVHSASTSPVYYSPPTVSTTLGRATEWIAGQIEVHTSSKNHEQVAVIGSTGTYFKYGVTVNTFTATGLTQGASSYWLSWVRYGSSGTYEGLLRAASFYAYGTIFSTSGAVLGGSTITAVISSTYCWNGLCYNMPMADGTNGQVLSTNGNKGLSWAAGGGLSNPFSAKVNAATFSITNVGQFHLISSNTYADVQNTQSVDTGAIMGLYDGTVLISTKANATNSWIPLAQTTEVDVVTGAVAIWEFKYSDIATRYTTEKFNPGRVGYVTGTSSGILPVGIHGTAAFVAGITTGNITIPNDPVWMSGHQGDSTHGIMAWSFWVYQSGASSTNQFYFAKRAGSGYEYGFYRIKATGVLHFDLLTNAGAAAASLDTNSGSLINLNAWNHIMLTVDKSGSGATITELWVNGAAAALTQGGTPATTSNGTSSSFTMGTDGGGTSTDNCDCRIDKMKIYFRHMTAADAASLFAEKKF